MATAIARALTSNGAGAAERRWLNLHERAILGFFLALAGLGLWRSIAPWHLAVLLLVPATVWWLLRFGSQTPRPWVGVVREWVSLGMILPAYWVVEWFRQPYSTKWQAAWLHWDHWLLHDAGLKRGVEALGGLMPLVLETAYLLLYAIPATSLALLYTFGERRRVNRFFEVLFLGTLTAYALLPLLPVQSPRVAFAGQDLPLFNGFPRSLNVWLLDHLDISTSVFPSGHVAVAFSSALGMMRAVPRRKLLWLPVLGMALLIFVATIYGRYHYAADGLASIAIAAAAWWLSDRMRADAD